MKTITHSITHSCLGLVWSILSSSSMLGADPAAPPASSGPRDGTSLAGRLRAFGTIAVGEEINLSYAKNFDDFVKVEQFMDRWVGIRQGGEVVSNDSWLLRRRNVIDVGLTDGQSYIVTKDGRVDSEPEDEEIPRGIRDAIGISVSYQDRIVLKRDGTVVAWGRTFSRRDAGPPATLNNVVAVTSTWGAGENPTQGFALKSNGQIVTWDLRQARIRLPNDLPPMQQIAAGWEELVCLSRDGRLLQLAPGKPVSPPPLPADAGPFDQVRARGPNFAARSVSGQWYAWGDINAGAVKKINTLKNATTIAFGANSNSQWDAVLWIEPPALAAAAATVSVNPTASNPGPLPTGVVENTLGMRFVPLEISGGPTDGRQLYFSVWETRVKDYEAFVKETGREWPRPGFDQAADHPAVNVSWHDARAFCDWLTKRERRLRKLGADRRYRLPTDHEWSCAMGIGDLENPDENYLEKKGKIATFPWGKEFPPPPDIGNYYGEENRSAPLKGRQTFMEGYEDGFLRTSPVGSFPPNPHGLFDLSGNALEWCLIRFDAPKEEHPPLRGGAWLSSHQLAVRTSERLQDFPGTYRSEATGFRIVVALDGGKNH